MSKERDFAQYVPVYHSWTLSENNSSKIVRNAQASEQTTTQGQASFPETMQSQRIQVCMSIDALADATGIPADKLAAFERNDEEPSQEIAEKVSNAIMAHASITS